MSFMKYMADRWKTTLLLLFAIITVEIFLLIYDVGEWFRLYCFFSIFLMYLLGNVIEYHSKKVFYRDIHEKLEELESKYLIMEMIENVNTMEEQQLCEILQEAGKSMTENVNRYRHSQEEYKDYIEMWIHEVKLPIATAKMIIENNKNEVTRKMEEELNDIENYTEQALYYARSNHTQKDYFVAKVNLYEMITETIKKRKRAVIANKMKIDVEIAPDVYVYTDAKWCQFILNQIIQNSMQYKKGKNPQITFSAEEKKNQMILLISDNGVGIKAGEVGRVFEKGFCGTNGRSGKKATGIGLYLCKKLCDKLGLGIELESVEGSGTTVKIHFPCNSFIIL